MSYIIKISFELRDMLSYFDLEEKKNKKIRKIIKRSKKYYIMILWRVMTSHIKSVMNKIC